MNYKNKLFMTKKKAFTLIELLIVIAIIGILFIVLVSKVDFATDKAKATGVQTDFRSFQVAIESVAKENAGLATFGWDTGDVNGDRIRNSYDAGDTNQDGVCDANEVWTGHKVYSETWTNVYTLTNPADADDKSAIAALEAAINANLDPKLHITIHDDYTITMANGAQDPWKTEYHGYYITNAINDNKDRGAIVMYSNGANQEFGSEHSIAGGVVTVNVPGNNVYGKDDYSLVSCYTYVNGYGEVKTTTTGFSNNQGGGQAGTDGTLTPGGGIGETPDEGTINMIQGANLVYTGSEEMKFISNAEFIDFEIVTINGVELDESHYTKSEGSTIIVLDQRYCYGLANGQYTISIVSSTGTATCNFTVNKPVLQLQMNQHGFYDCVLYKSNDDTYIMLESSSGSNDCFITDFYDNNGNIIPTWSYSSGQFNSSTRTITERYRTLTVSEDGRTITSSYGEVFVLQENLLVDLNAIYNTVYTFIDNPTQSVIIDKIDHEWYTRKMTISMSKRYDLSKHRYEIVAHEWSEEGEIYYTYELVIYDKVSGNQVGRYACDKQVELNKQYQFRCGCSFMINENEIVANIKHELYGYSMSKLVVYSDEDADCEFFGGTWHMMFCCSVNSNKVGIDWAGE